MAEYLEQQVGVGLSGDGHPQEIAVGEVELGSRPGGCSWGKYTSRSGPCNARQSHRRCSVRNWDALNRPGCCSPSQSIIVVAFSLPVGSFRSSGSTSSSHTPSKGSGRVRHRCSGFACDGNGPLCHLRAERTPSQPWPLPFPVSCLPYVSASIASGRS